MGRISVSAAPAHASAHKIAAASAALSPRLIAIPAPPTTEFTIPPERRPECYRRSIFDRLTSQPARALSFWPPAPFLSLRPVVSSLPLWYFYTRARQNLAGSGCFLHTGGLTARSFSPAIRRRLTSLE